MFWHTTEGRPIIPRSFLDADRLFYLILAYGVGLVGFKFEQMNPKKVPLRRKI